MGFTINQIIILESHRPGDRPTSNEVVQQIKFVGIKKRYPEMVQLIPVPNRQTLFSVLDEINAHTNDWLKPLIHFEMHGSPEGIELAEEVDVMTWLELKEPIREINITSKNNLFVSLATCYGGHFLKLYECYEPCPFYGYVGPMVEVDAKALEDSFVIFFTTLLETNSVPKALAEIQLSLLSPSDQGQFSFINCDDYFNKLMVVYNKQISDEKVMKDWLEALMIRGRQMHPTTNDKILKAAVENHLSPENLSTIVNDWRKIFLHQNHTQ
jgi:hypothetical protein